MTAWLETLWQILADPKCAVRRAYTGAKWVPPKATFVLPLLTPVPSAPCTRLSPLRAQDVVHWNAAGDGFIIKSIREFEQRVLATYYKHR